MLILPSVPEVATNLPEESIVAYFTAWSLCPGFRVISLLNFTEKSFADSSNEQATRNRSLPVDSKFVEKKSIRWTGDWNYKTWFLEDSAWSHAVWLSSLSNFNKSMRLDEFPAKAIYVYSWWWWEAITSLFFEIFRLTILLGLQFFNCYYPLWLSDQDRTWIEF